MQLLEGYRQWRREQRALSEARLLLREARRIQSRFAHRLNPEQSAAVAGAVEQLELARRDRRYDVLWHALKALDATLDEHCGFARKSPAREYAESIATAVFIALFLRAFVVEAFQIPSGSMIPTLQVGDYIFVNKFIYGLRLPLTNLKFGWRLRTPERGEVIVFSHPKEADKDLIKRVVAIEGDTVEVRDNNVYVNGKQVARQHVEGACQYVDHDETTDTWDRRDCVAFKETLDDKTFTTLTEPQGSGRSFGPQKVPAGTLFVLGDNRDNSSDSRFWGFVPYQLVKGKAMFVWWSRSLPDGVRLERILHRVQ